MKITFLTLFPSSFESFLSFPVTKRAIDKGLVEVNVVDIKEHTDGSFRAIDDSPYGGGAGMLIRVDSLHRALNKVKTASSYVVLLSPKGKPYNQEKVRELSSKEDLILISGHYEGFDKRVEKYVDEEISIGDYILTGGELPSMIVADSVIRLQEGVLRSSSIEEESFNSSLLEYPQYTHPLSYEGEEVPSILLSGDKEEIAKWREIEAIKETIKRRSDLLLPKERRRSCKDFIYSTLIIYPTEEEVYAYKNLQDKLPISKVLFEEDPFLLVSKVKGKPLSEISNSNRVRNALYSLFQLCLNSSFSIGSFSLDNVYVFGKGLSGVKDISKCHSCTKTNLISEYKKDSDYDFRI